MVWIIGASTGIGEYLAYELASHGAKVVLSARRETELEKVKARCLGKNVVFHMNSLTEVQHTFP